MGVMRMADARSESGATQDVVTRLAVRDPAMVTLIKATTRHPVQLVAYPGWHWVERDGLMHHEPADTKGVP